jgi:hypothetical protein
VTSVSYNVCLDNEAVALIFPMKGCAKGIPSHLTSMSYVQRASLLLSSIEFHKELFMGPKSVEVLPLLATFFSMMIFSYFSGPTYR